MANHWTAATLPRDVVEALLAFRREHGRRWKAALREVWLQGRDEGIPALRRARNMVGPSDLDHVRLPSETNRLTPSLT